MLHWEQSHKEMQNFTKSKNGQIRNANIRESKIAPIEGKLQEVQLKWYGDILMRPINALVKQCEIMTKMHINRGRTSPKKI